MILVFFDVLFLLLYVADIVLDEAGLVLLPVVDSG